MTEMHHNLEISICDPLKHKIDYPIRIVSICLGESIRMIRVNSEAILCGKTCVNRLLKNRQNKDLYDKW